MTGIFDSFLTNFGKDNPDPTRPVSPFGTFDYKTQDGYDWYGPLDYRAAARTLFLRPYLAHFFPFFRHFFAVFSVLTPGFQNVAPKDRGHAA